MYDTQVTLVGNLVADPRIHTLPDGQVVASFRIASTRRGFDRSAGQWRDFDTTYVNVTCWRGLGENAAASLKKGQSALVWGRLSVRSYETKDGAKRESVEIEAFSVGPDLSRVITLVKRAERSAGAVQSDSWSAAIPERASAEADDFADPADALRGDELENQLENQVDDEMRDERHDETHGALGDGPVDDAADRVANAPAGSDGEELVGAGVGAGAGPSGGRLKARFGIG